jgi:uncharacterized protein YndB with AHSA1/START domain
MPSEKSELNISRFIKAPPPVIWDALTTPEHLAKWWIPAPIECQVVKLDVRPGGAFETRMREGDGEFLPHVEGCFLEVVTEARLVWTTVLTGGWKPAEPWLALTAIVELQAQGSGTQYSSRVLHKNAADSGKHEEIHDGWGTVIEQLAALPSD